MSLYNMMAGFDPLAAILVHELGLDPRNVGRFRDCYLNEDGSNIVILTRMGGGNRPDYVDEIEGLRTHALYESDEDDGFDSTYAYFYFKVPDKCSENCAKAVANGHGRTPAIDRMMEMVEGMGDAPAPKTEAER